MPQLAGRASRCFGFPLRAQTESIFLGVYRRAPVGGVFDLQSLNIAAALRNTKPHVQRCISTNAACTVYMRFRMDGLVA